MLGSSKFSACWGVTGNFAANASKIPSCQDCFKALLQNVAEQNITCENCTNWNLSSDSKMLHFDPPINYPSTELLGEDGKISPMKLEYSSMIDAVSKTHRNVANEREESPIAFINSFLITAQREKQLHTEEPPNNTTDNKQLTPIQVIGKPSSIAPEYPEINDNNMDDAWKVTHVLKWKTDKKLGNLVYIRWNDRSEGWYDQKIPELNEWGKEIEKIMNSQKPVNDVRKKGKKGRAVK